MKEKIIIIVTILLLLLNVRMFCQQPYMVKDINPGTNTSFNYQPGFTAIGSTLYFSASDGSNGLELWKSDGTSAGTIMVKDIYSGYQFANVPNNSEPRNLTNVNGSLYFTANDGINGAELWKSDGTEVGTVMVKNINIYPNFSDGGSDGAWLTNVNGVLYFTCNNIDNGYELWKSDGTAIGTVMIKDIYTGNNLNGLPNRSNPNNLINVNGALFFAAHNEINGNELWKSDGTEAGTVMVGGLPGIQSSIGTYPNFCNVNGTLYYAGYSQSNGRDLELWKSDGTNAGTVQVKDIYPGYDAQNNYFYSSSPQKLINVNGTLFFSACDSEIDSNNQNFELWKSDGTATGTIKVKDIRVGTFNYGSFPSSLTNANGVVYFNASDGVHGNEMWKSDGTEAGTILVKDINTLPFAPSDPSGFTNINGTIYFGASDNNIGQELFKTDGTANGTVGYNIRFLSESSSPEYLTNVNGKLFFIATNGGQSGRELWVLDTNLLSTSEYKTNDNKFAIFPNPVNNILSIQNFENKLIDKITILDLTGKMVLEQENNSNSINVENLQSGMYLLQILSEEKSCVSKFIKN